MSKVTGLLICHSLMEEYNEDESGKDHYPLIDAINVWLAGENKIPLVELDELMSCGKHPQMKVWGAGYNYLPDDEFIAIFRNTPWECPDEVFLVLTTENGPMRVIVPYPAPRINAYRRALSESKP